MSEISAARRFYLPELDALRFVAFMLVFWVHSHFATVWMMPFVGVGAYGVSIFFLLSAYLIFTILLRELSQTKTVNIQRFAVRRILRIWPLYFAVLTATYLTGRFWMPYPLTGHAFVMFSVMLGNAYIIHHGWLILGPAGVLWTLSIEEQFYLCVPVITRFTGRRGIAVLSALMLAGAYIALFVFGRMGANPTQTIRPNSFVQFQFFAAGGLLALYFENRTASFAVWQRFALAGVTAVCFLTAAIYVPLDLTFPLTPLQLTTGGVLVLAGSVCLFLSFFGIQAKIPASLIYLGKISYGLYIFHLYWLWFFHEGQPQWLLRLSSHRVMHDAQIPLALICTFATAALSYRFFERPILLFKQRFETVRTRPA